MDQALILPLFEFDLSLKSSDQELLTINSAGYNKKCDVQLISAKDDLEAICSFLSEYEDSLGTLKNYIKEIENLLLWCIHIQKTAISDLRRDDLVSYQSFLKSPKPKKLWCGPSVARFKKDGSQNPNWRPFVKGLGESSIKRSITMLDSFFNYLVQTNYLVGNPLAVNRRRKKRQGKPKLVDRYLELKEIHAVLDTLSSYPIDESDDTALFQVIRARYIIMLLFYTGMRIAEAAEHRMGNFIQRENNWFLRVTGKGKKTREIPVPHELLDVLAEFRTSVGLISKEPKFRERTPLIPMQNLKQSISTRRIDQILRWAFNLAADRIETKAARQASKLRSASAHWLRHSYVTYLLDSGAPLKVAQENAGHTDIGTTMHYRHVNQTDRHSATQNLSLSTGSEKTQKSEII